MPATELVVISAGIVGEKEILIPTGKQRSIFSRVQDWVNGKLKAKTSVKGISTSVLVKGIKQWAVYEEKSGSKKLRTVFEIT